MKHSRARDLLSEYLEHDLAGAQREELEAHLATCANCEADLEELRGAIDLLRRLPDPEPPPFLTTRVMARIAAGEGRSAGFRRWLEALGTPLVAASLAAAAAALAVFSFAPPQAELQIVENRPDHLPRVAHRIVQQPVGQQQWPDPHLLALNLRGASHPHSTALAGHFDDPVRAVAYQPR